MSDNGSERYTHTVVKDTLCYKDGPQQARPADWTLQAGTRVEELDSTISGYALVRAENGATGHVNRNDLEPTEMSD